MFFSIVDCYMMPTRHCEVALMLVSIAHIAAHTFLLLQCKAAEDTKGQKQDSQHDPVHRLASATGCTIWLALLPCIC